MEIKTSRDLRIALAEGLRTSLGGYPLLWLMSDGECICPKCARNNRALLRLAMRDKRTTGYCDRDWLPVAIDVHWEGAPIQCAHCNGLIESAYGEPDED